jgi:hypothetical protein
MRGRQTIGAPCGAGSRSAKWPAARAKTHSPRIGAVENEFPQASLCPAVECLRCYGLSSLLPPSAGVVTAHLAS